MSNVITLEVKRHKELRELNETRDALKTIYDSLDTMYATLSAVEEKCKLAEDHYNNQIEAYIDEVGPDNVPDEYLEFYTRDFDGALDNLVITAVTAEEFDKLMEHPDFPKVLADPDAVRKFLGKDEDGEH